MPTYFRRMTNIQAISDETLLHVSVYPSVSPQNTSPLTTRAVLTTTSGLILGLRPANERRRYSVTSSLIGWTQT